MEEEIEQEKHEISVLTENTLYNKIRGFNEDGNLDDKTRQELKSVTIDTFVEYCVERYKTLRPEQIREHVLLRLNKTLENMKKLKEDDGR